MGQVDIGEFEAANTRPGSGRCQAHRARDMMNDDQRAKFDVACDRATVQHKAIATVLVSWGFDVRADAVARYRKGDCRCD